MTPEASGAKRMGPEGGGASEEDGASEGEGAEADTAAAAAPIVENMLWLCAETRMFFLD